MFGITKEKFMGSNGERLDKQLSSRKGRCFSMGGHITLSKSVLSSIPIYFLFVV